MATTTEDRLLTTARTYPMAGLEARVNLEIAIRLRTLRQSGSLVCDRLEEYRELADVAETAAAIVTARSLVASHAGEVH